MNNAVRLLSGLAFVAVLTLNPAANAQSEDLAKAKGLFERGAYVAAQGALLGIDRDSLGDEEKQELDRLLAVVPEAVQASQKAEQSMAEADQAYEQGRWDGADALYKSVIDNEYAREMLRQEARRQRQRIVEKKALSDAAKPEGPTPVPPPVEPKQAVEPPAPAPAPEQAQPQQQQPPAVETAAPRQLTIIGKMRRNNDLRWQRAVQKMKESANRARAAVAAGDFDQARQQAESAIQFIEAARGYAEPVSKYQTAKAAALALKNEVSAAFDAHQSNKAREQRIEIMRRQDERRRLLENQRREKVEQLFNTADQLRREQRFADEVEIYKQIIWIDKANSKARDRLFIAEDYLAVYRQRDMNNTVRRETRRALYAADEVLIPWNVEVLYPSNWLQISARREGLLGPRYVEDRELNRRLDETFPDVHFEETPFELVVEYLRDHSEANIAVDWDDLEGNAIERDDPVSLSLRGVPFATVLNEALNQLGGDTSLGYSVADGLIRIATRDKLDRDKFIRVYDMRDLLVDIPHFANAARLDPGQALEQINFTQGRGASNLFDTSNMGDYGGNAEVADGGGGGKMAHDIMDTIRMTVAPDSWRETGGGNASLRELNGQLVVYNTSDAQRSVADLLGQLREARALQISLEARFLTVTNNFLEEIGVDLDFVFNAGTAGFDRAFNATGQEISDPFTLQPLLIPRPFSQIGAFAAPPGGGAAFTGLAPPVQPFNQPAFVPAPGGIIPDFGRFTPIPARMGSINIAQAQNFNTGVPGTFSTRTFEPALSIAGSFLDNLQVDFLIRATQANARSSIVQSPRLVMFNGQRANIFSGTARTYVASLQPQLAEGAAAFAPVIGQANAGMSLDVEGTISADRKYVTVTVRATQANEPIFNRVTIQQGSGNSPSAFVTTLQQQVSSINTTVSIPDGGTVLLGGVKLLGEVEVEAGVPILSKIPILKRAFTNATTIKDTQTLLILMKAKIIIQHEAEEEAFPVLGGIGG